MLNISKKRINDRLDTKRYKSFEKLNNPFIGPKVKRTFFIAASISLVGLFLPWTQNIQAKGTVTMRQPEQRPSEIQAAIAGQIAQWYVSEGDLVTKGDTIARLQEIKNEYLDPELIARTREQLDAKNDGIKSYLAKVDALQSLITTLRTNQQISAQSLTFKLQASRAAAQADSGNYAAEIQNLKVAQDQANRFEQLFNQGLKSRTEVEQYRVKLAQSNAKTQEAERKWEMSKNKLLEAKLELKTTVMLT